MALQPVLEGSTFRLCSTQKQCQGDGVRLPPLPKRGRKSGSARFVHLQEKLDAQSKELSGFTTHVNSDMSRPETLVASAVRARTGWTTGQDLWAACVVSTHKAEKPFAERTCRQWGPHSPGVPGK